MIYKLPKKVKLFLGTILYRWIVRPGLSYLPDSWFEDNALSYQRKITKFFHNLHSVADQLDYYE